LVFLLVPRLENLYQHVPDFLKRKGEPTHEKLSREHQYSFQPGLVVLWTFEESREELFKVLDDDGGEVGVVFVEFCGYLGSDKINTIPRHKTRCLFT
jgi:hypothetical protein